MSGDLVQYDAIVSLHRNSTFVGDWYLLYKDIAIPNYNNDIIFLTLTLHQEARYAG
jgi:hypothetical protein